MSGGSDDDGVRARDAHIFEAYQRAAEYRERAELAPFVGNALSEDVASAEYHAAVIEYFSRLEPHLPERPEYWENVSLFPTPVGGDREPVVQALADCYGLSETDAVGVLDYIESDPAVPVEDPRGDVARGLRTLQRWRGRTTTVEQTHDDPREGVVTRQVTQPVYLPKRLTLRAHAVLNEAAASLGFGPESKTIEEWDEDPV
jgi:hypothetical protein